MRFRSQNTLTRPTHLVGRGFLSGQEIRVDFHPAPANHGIVFVRTDLAERIAIPAEIEYVAPRSRRTALEYRGAQVELIEHAMAALAGLRIDNCLIELNGPELPAGDGSSLAFTDVLGAAGTTCLGVPRSVCQLAVPARCGDRDRDDWIAARPSSQGVLTITYELDYGPGAYIPAQTRTFTLSPENFLHELAFARTFLLEAEALAIREQGIGQHVSTADLLVYGANGVVGNSLRAADECVRHKLLDCVGDFALLGCDLAGHVLAHRSGHRHNAELIRAIRQHTAREDLRRAA